MGIVLQIGYIEREWGLVPRGNSTGQVHRVYMRNIFIYTRRFQYTSFSVHVVFSTHRFFTLVTWPRGALLYATRCTVRESADS